MEGLGQRPPRGRGLKRFITGLLVGVALTVATPLIIIGLGVPDVAATTGAGFLERTLAPWALTRSIERRAPKAMNPLTGDAAAAREGLAHFRENCMVCHAAPGVRPSEIARGMNPAPPDLEVKDVQDTPDGALHWVIQHGIRMTGMPGFGPTHTDQELWRVVTFVRRLPLLTEEERRLLGRPEEEHH